MQHLDDGYLQSWLDRDRSGITRAEAAAVEAHVAACEVCAARLAELEETSEQARSLLAAAAPSGAPAPDFDDVVRRSRRRGGPGKGGPGWMAAGWAASLVLATGLGWMTHDLLRAGVDERSPTPAREAEAPASAAERPPVATEPPPAAAEADRDVAEAADRVPPAAVEEAPAAADTGEPEPTSLVLQGRVVGDDGAPLPSAQVSIPGTGAGTVSDADGTFTLAVPAQVAAADPERPVSLVAQLLGFQTATRDVPPGAGDTVSLDFRLQRQALRLQGVVVSEAEQADTDERAALRAPAAEADLTGEVWAPADRDRAEDAAGFTVVTVPDLPVLEIELGQIGDVVAVRVRQALASGATLTIVQWKGDGPAVDPILPLGQPVATARTQDLEIRGSAPLPLDSLQTLLRRVR